MKASWESKTIGELCELTSGLWKGKRGPLRRVGVIRNTNFNADGTLDDTDIAYLDVEERQLAKRLLRPGDIILEKSGGGPKQPVGRVVVFQEAKADFSYSNFTSAIRVKHSAQVDFRYLHKYLWWLHSSGVTESIQSHSTGIRNLDLAAYKALAVPVPSLAEQKRIVATLDRTFGNIEDARINTRASLESLCLAFEATREIIFHANSGWEMLRLKEICEIKHGFAFEGEYFRTEGRYALLTPGNFYEKGGYRDRGKKQKFYDGPIPEGFVLSKGDLLVAMTEQAAGLLASSLIVPESDKFLHNQRLGLVTSKNDPSWHPEFLFHFFNTKAVRRAIHASASGVKVRHTSPGKILDLTIFLPHSINDQIRVAKQLNELYLETQELEKIYLNKITAFTELRQSLLYQAFSGNL